MSQARNIDIVYMVYSVDLLICECFREIEQDD